MKRVLVTGSEGFIGRNLTNRLRLLPALEIVEFDLQHSPQHLKQALESVDIILHLAGVNRPESPEEFAQVNAGLVKDICAHLSELQRAPKIVLSSSIQVELNNDYGRSKAAAERALVEFGRQTGAEIIIYRLKNVFGKWCRPNYNSVVATFCHNIARDLPVTISDPENIVNLVYIDDVVDAFVLEVQSAPDVAKGIYRDVQPAYRVTLGQLVKLVKEFRNSRTSLYLPDVADPLTAKLYATYLSYLPTEDFGYNLNAKYDDRGGLAEFIKSPAMGQLFISRTKPGVTRGNHYHHTKVEKFFVVEGKGVIRFRSIQGSQILEYPVDGRDFRVIDIPPGYTHSIENIGSGEMVVLFWASEIYDPDNTDTHFLKVME